MTIDEMIAVLQGAKAGKAVQYLPILAKSRGWKDSNSPGESLLWDFVNYSYRLKPEPREFWISPETREIYEPAQFAKLMVDQPANVVADLKRDMIHVREVLD